MQTIFTAVKNRGNPNGCLGLLLISAENIHTTAAVYYSLFIDAAIIVCHNILFTHLTFPLFLFTATFAADPTVNALMCILVLNLLTVPLYALVYLLLRTDFSARPTLNQVLNLAIVLGTGTYLNGQMKSLTLGSQAEMIQYSIFSIMLQIALLFCLIFNENLNHNIRDKLAMRSQLNHARLLLKSVEQKRANEEALRDIHHSIKNHLSAIRYLINDQGDEKALEYIDELIGVRALPPRRVNTGCDFLDALLEEKLDRIEQNHIRTDFRADLRPLSDIPPIDLCLIFGNLLDNAIEACERIPQEERFLSLCTTQSAGYMIVAFENSYDGKHAVFSHLPMTTKADRESHGLGLKQVKKTLHKHGGILTLKADQEKKRFSVFASFPLNRQAVPASKAP